MTWELVILILGSLAIILIGMPWAMSKVKSAEADKLHAEARKAGR